MTDHPDIEADGWVNVLIKSVLILCLLDRAQKCLSFGHSLALVQLCLPLLLLSNDSLVFAVSTVVQTDEALSNLEEVLIRLIRAEVSHKVEAVIGSYGFHLGSNLEGVRAPLFGHFVVDLEEGPVDVD